ncbi:transporter associated domain-containing protein [Mesobacillus campisalis]|uniref:transporter associated domain-containing protein n=1 Tax=Mesobacillus campisalis TaxID=1408103 RepID=UPI000B2A3563|nr:transporter associated domain-containing protein [Mesobacillus campisalis]
MLYSPAGCLTPIAGHIPENGESFVYDNLEVTVTLVEDHRIKQVKMTKIPKAENKQE